MTEETLFHETLAQPPAERAAFLDQVCAGQPELRAAVEALLAAHEAPGSLLDRPPSGLAQAVASDRDLAPLAGPGEHSPDPAAAPLPVAPAAYPPPLTAGRVIAGRYLLQQKLGEGGMGEVWVAQQTEPVKRTVALKLIKPGMDSKAVLARFEQERQALALMDHPNIARVLDGGLTPTGQPFFVMELVNGLPLTRFCDEARLTPQARLELFVPICQAVQHAHQKGIIHRDLKPANILVTLIDGRPVPRVIDFGVAKATADKLTDDSLTTQLGAVVGTLEYMAPEQAGFAGADIDTRADIYSLGVILYELLTGLRPLDAKHLKRAALTEVVRILREEDPSRPSTRLSRDEALPALAALRQTEPKKLLALLRGELDWVVLRCLEKQRDRRYETANGLARDLQRYLADEPVEARPPSLRYRLGKFLRRNQGPMLAASLVLLALLGGIAGTTHGMLRAEQRRLEADKARQREAARAEGERRAKEREAKERSRAERARDRTRQALDAMTSSVTGDSLTTQKELSAEQKKFLTEVLSYYQDFAGERVDDEASRARTALAAFRVGAIQYRLGRKEEPAAAFRQALTGYARLAADFPALPEYRSKLANSHNNLGGVLVGLGEWAEAERQHRRALALQEKLAADFHAVPEYRHHLATSHHNLGDLLKERGKRAEAERRYRRALALTGKLATDFPKVPEYRRKLAASHLSLGRLLAGQGEGAEAERQYRKALAVYEQLAADFPAVPEYRYDQATSHHSLGILLNERGKRAEAERQYRQAVTLRGRLATDFPAVPAYRQTLAMSRHNLGRLLAGLGKGAEAERQYRQALALQEELATDFPTVPEHRRGLAYSHHELVILLAESGKGPEAERQGRRALALRQKLAADFPAVPRYRRDLADSHGNLGVLLARLGKGWEAERQYRQALAFSEKLAADFPAVPQHALELARIRHNLGNLLADLGKGPEAERQHRQALTLFEQLVADFPAVPAYRRRLASSHNSLGALLWGLGKGEEAERQYRQALALREKLAADSPAVPQYQIDVGGSCCNLGNLFSAGGRSGDSLVWYNKAIRILTAAYDQDRRVAVARQVLRNSHRGRALAYGRLKKYAEAVQDWDRAIALSPEPAQPRLCASRAAVRLNAGQVAEAVAEVAELAKLPN
jgi:serine/threonine protein kinase/Flp pilus assembly protein TadD